MTAFLPCPDILLVADCIYYEEVTACPTLPLIVKLLLIMNMDDPTPWMSHLISRKDFSPRERKKIGENGH